MKPSSAFALKSLLHEIKHCSICAQSIPAPNPVVSAPPSARILIIGQAPGAKVHASGIPWDDTSGNRLRRWMDIDERHFYDESLVAILPMGFCYPGKGKSGDLPPRPECAPTWHEQVLAFLPNIQCTLLIGQHAQNQYSESAEKTLTQRVQTWREYAPKQYLLPHPSPRNQLWLSRNPWFESETVPAIQQTIRSISPQTPNAAG
jgi:uracil-DNA glycosylase